MWGEKIKKENSDTYKKNNYLEKYTEFYHTIKMFLMLIRNQMNTLH